jgi:hypothetical protein
VVPPVVPPVVKNPVAGEFDLSGLALKSLMTSGAPLAPDLLAAFQRTATAGRVSHCPRTRSLQFHPFCNFEF